MPRHAFTAEKSTNGIHYLTAGPAHSKQGLVCVHGWGCRGSDYVYSVQHLLQHARGVRVIAPDLPGHGNTTTAVCPKATVTGFATMLLELVREVGLDNVVLAGHSMGCRIILEAWQQAEHQSAFSDVTIKGLVFLDGSHYKLRSLHAFDDKDPRSRGMTAEEKAAAKTRVYESMFSANTPVDFCTNTLAQLDKLDKEYTAAIRVDFLDYDYTRMDDAMAELGRSSTPVVSVTSTDIGPDNERMPVRSEVPTKFMRYVAEKVPQVQMRSVERSGHFPHVDQPVVIAECMKELVAECGFGKEEGR
ncbi:hypothetical protein BAUCODRAFT_545888 [Baudoinia panamericana UAMH 10762]|uniref:AB hydrolase-1 domain-containing protein n=1 Tax=Baudoinia panamericana (strain UAMH 10762) TaxID=717646 RepID=M2N6H1_BAUPA|nr:uncharacterized protein BAUCODRAFT_545888 [Baudoinia panamericana UAMH 10762]EMC94375.1 hypothetical protein BAUCODRAFT_545888 [Baudoinia panamericana UAMH 10762]